MSSPGIETCHDRPEEKYAMQRKAGTRDKFLGSAKHMQDIDTNTSSIPIPPSPIPGKEGHSPPIWQGAVEAQQVSREQLVVPHLQHLPHLDILPLHVCRAACNRVAPFAEKHCKEKGPHGHCKTMGVSNVQRVIGRERPLSTFSIN